MRAVQYIRSVPRYLLSRFLGAKFPSLYTGSLSLVKLRQVEPPSLPNSKWVRIRSQLSGICGSDLASICAKGSAYFSPITSTPFILGHEVVGEVIEAGDGVTTCKAGDRVVIEPALGCEVRGIEEKCPPCRAGQYAHCENVLEGDISPGIQTGYCRDTGGGWGEEFVAHQSQVFQPPENLSDEEAVLVEPFSCSLHAALAGRPEDDQTALVIGCGAIGLLLIASLRGTDSKCRIIAVARHPHQQQMAKELGADEVIEAGDSLYEKLSRSTSTRLYKPEIGRDTGVGGIDVTFDCVGTDSSIDDALRFTHARGRVVLVGMPSIPKHVDWTAIWYKSLKVEGIYAYGWEEYENERIRTFDLAMRLMSEGKVKLASLVGARYPLEQYREAVKSALKTGQSRAVKTVIVVSENGA